MAGQGGIKTAPLFMVGIGVMLSWSALKGKSWSAVLKDLISGKNPVNLGQTQAIQGTPASAFGYGSLATPGGPAGTSPGLSGRPNETQWSTAFLKALGAPTTNANIVSINAWQAHEGGGGQNNPLNTTLNCCGALGNFNSVGVKNYPTPNAGVEANVATLRGGGYGDILMALMSGRGLCGQTFAGLARWSNNGYSSVC